MATLTAAEKAKIAELIVYLRNGFEKPLDAKVVDVLRPMSDKFGFGCGCSRTLSLEEALRDAPFSTLLSALLAVAA